jgi:hypothetical protein
MDAVRIVIITLVLSGATWLSWQMAVAGVGLSDDLQQTASVRVGSAGGSRVVVGGGIHGGK